MAEDAAFDNSYAGAMDEFIKIIPPFKTSYEDNVNAVYLYNADNSFVIHEKNSQSLIYPASTVKIMSGLLFCRILSNRLDEKVTVTSAMLADTYGRSMGLEVGEEITIRDLLYASICGSYNDAASALAVICEGSVQAFVDRMNSSAEDFKMPSSVYTNPTGLHDDAMVTTAADVARLANIASTDALYMEICSAKQHTIPATNISDPRTFTNRNPLVSGTDQSYYNGFCKGMNAGSTDEGGQCVVTLWERGGASNICVVMGGKDIEGDAKNYAISYANAILSWAGSNFGSRTMFSKHDVLEHHSINMTGTSKSEAAIALGVDLELYLPKALNLDSLSWKCHYDDLPLTAPLRAGQCVGRVVVSYDSFVLGSAPIVVEEDFVASGFLIAMNNFRNYLGSRAFIASVIVFVVLLVIYLRWTYVPGDRFTVKKGARYAKKPTRRRRRLF